MPILFFKQSVAYGFGDFGGNIFKQLGDLLVTNPGILGGLVGPAVPPVPGLLGVGGKYGALPIPGLNGGLYGGQNIQRGKLEK